MRRALLEGGTRDRMPLLAVDPVSYGRVSGDASALPYWPVFLEGREAAVSNDIRPRHIGRGVRKKELHYAVIFVGVGHAAERHFGVVAGKEGGILIVVDPAKRERVHPHA